MSGKEPYVPEIVLMKRQLPRNRKQEESERASRPQPRPSRRGLHRPPARTQATVPRPSGAAAAQRQERHGSKCRGVPNPAVPSLTVVGEFTVWQEKKRLRRQIEPARTQSAAAAAAPVASAPTSRDRRCPGARGSV